jgi:hypothetical protein
MQGIYLNARAQIRFQDDTTGILHRVVFEPKSHRVTDLVVSKGRLQKHEHVIPIWLATWKSPQELDVALDSQAWAHYPAYQEVEYAGRRVSWEHDLQPGQPTMEQPDLPIPTVHYRVPEGIPFDEAVIGSLSMVRNADGMVGQVEFLVLDRESWEITHLILRDALSAYHVVIPVPWITGITPDEIYIQGDNNILHRVPTMQWEAELANAWSMTWQIDHTLLDPSLAIADEVARRLAEDERIASSAVEVTFDRGVITLAGTVETEQAHEVAEEIARRCEGVISVVNALEVRSDLPGIAPMAGALERAITQSFGIRS